jgi:hypothetical protein
MNAESGPNWTSVRAGAGAADWGALPSSGAGVDHALREKSAVHAVAVVVALVLCGMAEIAIKTPAPIDAGRTVAARAVRVDATIPDRTTFVRYGPALPANAHGAPGAVGIYCTSIVDAGTVWRRSNAGLTAGSGVVHAATAGALSACFVRGTRECTCTRCACIGDDRLGADRTRYA